MSALSNFFHGFKCFNRKGGTIELNRFHPFSKKNNNQYLFYFNPIIDHFLNRNYGPTLIRFYSDADIVY